MSKTTTETLVLIDHLARERKMSSKEIGALIGKSPKAVQKIFVRYGISCLPQGAQRGEQNHFYKRGWMIDKDGYKLVRAMDHPFCNRTGYIREHRLVMEKHLERYLLKTEVVHHINTDKLDNHIENLKLYSRNSQHLHEELKGKIPKWSAGGILRIRAGLMKSLKTRGISNPKVTRGISNPKVKRICVCP